MLLSLQQDIVDRLSADPFFTGVPIISRVKKDLLNEIQTQLDKIVLGGIVFIASGTAQHVRGTWLDPIKLQIGFVENRTLNTTGKTCEECVEKTFGILSGYIPTGLTVPLMADSPTIIEVPPETSADANKRVMALQMVGQGDVSYIPPQVAAPVITNTAGTVAITCDTAHALIFYTIDGAAAPQPYDTLYTAPFTPGSGHIIAAHAYFPGLLASAVPKLTT